MIATMNIGVQVFVWMYVFTFRGYIHRNAIAESYGNYIKPLEKLLIIFQKDYTILKFHQ